MEHKIVLTKKTPIVTASKAQYIRFSDTTLDSTTTFEIKASSRGGNDSDYLLAVGGLFLLGRVMNYYSFLAEGDAEGYLFNFPDTNAHVIRYDGQYFYIDGNKAGNSPHPLHAGNTSTTITIGENYTGTTGDLSGDFYYCKIWKNGTLVHNLIPAKQGSTYGISDEITSTFYASATATAFTGGETDATVAEFKNDPEAPAALVSVRTNEEFSFCGDELAYDTMEAVVQYRTDPDVDIRDVPYGSAVYYYCDGTLKAKFYTEKIERIARSQYRLLCLSAIGLLDRQYYYGGVFNAKTLNILTEIMYSTTLSYQIEYELGEIYLYGWIPYGTIRDCLRQVLFASGGHVYKDASGNLIFRLLPVSELTEIPTDRVFMEGREEFPRLATKLTLVEHSFYYVSSVSPVTLFDNTDGTLADHLLVLFSEAPVYLQSVQASSGLTIHRLGENYAIVSGNGSITGKPYAHTTNNVIREADDADMREAYEVSVSDAYLVSATNSETVADRLENYYFSRYLVKAIIKWADEACGKQYTITDAFLETQTCFLVKMEKVMSSFIRASCEFVAGVSEGLEPFENYDLVTSSGRWTVPSGVTRIRLTIIGGGNGGDSGLRGTDGRESSGGIGGNAGIGGKGGRCLVVTLKNVSAGQYIDIAIGAGGIGGAACSSTTTPNVGGEGNPTTVTYKNTVYSSASGSRSSSGKSNPLSGDIYALPGDIGTSGGDGGDGGEGVSESGENAGEHFGGLSGNPTTAGYSQTSGGGGGGASASADGGNGGAATSVHTDVHDMQTDYDYYTHTPGAGGNGAAAAAQDAATVYGQGGPGGNGGGAGGGIGVFVGTMREWSGSAYDPDTGEWYEYVGKQGDELSDTVVSPGTGGNGGKGGNGAPGCVIIYY